MTYFFGEKHRFLEKTLSPLPPLFIYVEMDDPYSVEQSADHTADWVTDGPEKKWQLNFLLKFLPTSFWFLQDWIFVKLNFFVIISIWTLKMVEYFWKLKTTIYLGKRQPWSDLEGKPQWRRQENNHGHLFKSWQQYTEKLVRWLHSIQVAYKEERSIDLFWFWCCLIKSCVHKGWNSGGSFSKSQGITMVGSDFYDGR